jgi:hypothetical protein
VDSTSDRAEMVSVFLNWHLERQTADSGPNATDRERH